MGKPQSSLGILSALVPGPIPVGATTKELNAPTIFATAEGPELIDPSGTAACRINLLAGEYR